MLRLRLASRGIGLSTVAWCSWIGNYTATFGLAFNWSALGLDPSTSRLHVPAVPPFQSTSNKTKAVNAVKCQAGSGVFFWFRWLHHTNAPCGARWVR